MVLKVAEIAVGSCSEFKFLTCQNEIQSLIKTIQYGAYLNLILLVLFKYLATPGQKHSLLPSDWSRKPIIKTPLSLSLSLRKHPVSLSFLCLEASPRLLFFILSHSLQLSSVPPSHSLHRWLLSGPSLCFRCGALYSLLTTCVSSLNFLGQRISSYWLSFCKFPLSVNN